MTTRIRFLPSLVLLGALAAPATPAAAQLIRVPTPKESGRAVTAAVGLAYLQTQGRFDGQSGTAWALGEGFQYRGSLDVSTRAGAFGVLGTVASVPLLRSSNVNARGNIQLQQLLATFRSPDGSGFHQLIEVSTGLSQWANYSGSEVLTPAEQAPRRAFAIIIGYGIGFPMGERAAFTIVQDYSTLIGSAEGLPPGARRSQNQYLTRLGIRYRLLGSRP